jgi:hypothetical protein
MLLRGPRRFRVGACACAVICACTTLTSAAGCPLELPEPLRPASQAVADASLVGGWTCAGSGEADATVTVSQNPARTYTIELSAPGRATARLRAFITRTGQTAILNVQQIGGSDLVSTGRYAFVRYVRQRDGSLNLDSLIRANGVQRHRAGIGASATWRCSH